MNAWQSYSPAEITLDFADGEYRFALPWRCIAELQEVRGLPVTFLDGSTARRPKGIGQIWREVRERDYAEGDLTEVIRLGLIGGGSGVVGASADHPGDAVTVDASRAKQLLETYVRPLPLDAKWALAFAILAATVQGYQPPGKAPATVNPTIEETPETGSSTSPPPLETD